MHYIYIITLYTVEPYGCTEHRECGFIRDLYKDDKDELIRLHKFVNQQIDKITSRSGEVRMVTVRALSQECSYKMPERPITAFHF